MAAESSFLKLFNMAAFSADNEIIGRHPRHLPNKLRANSFQQTFFLTAANRRSPRGLEPLASAPSQGFTDFLRAEAPFQRSWQSRRARPTDQSYQTLYAQRLDTGSPSTRAAPNGALTVIESGFFDVLPKNRGWSRLRARAPLPT